MLADACRSVFKVSQTEYRFLPTGTGSVRTKSPSTRVLRFTFFLVLFQRMNCVIYTLITSKKNDRHK
jgi:hypothetical protein